MKELSIEEKAKAYDEAYKKVAVRFGSNVADEIFLKESEDERIRQDIITTLSIGVSCDESALHPCAHTTLKEAIAWLEKQGEQKIQRCGVSCFTDIVQAIRTVYNEESAYDLVEYLTDLVSKRTKSAWSEEDEYCIHQLIVFCENCMVQDDGAKRCAHWLKSLRPQNWTKEDKERYISCLQRLGTGDPKRPETINSKWFKEHVYPQKQWKPCDYELEVLRLAAEKDGTCLMGLYEQLKKLREE